MTVMAAITLGGLFAGCTKDADLSGGQNTAEFNIVQNYEKAFITRFGQPAANQTWGFGPASAGTRAVVGQPYVSVGDYTYNAQMALAWEGVDAAIESGTPQSSFDFMNSYAAWHNSGWSDRYYDVHGTVVTSELSDEFVAAARQVIVGTGDQPGLIPENVNNLAKAQSTGYSIVTTGGPVTLTPIYHYSNSGDRLSYYYYPVGQKPTAEQIKTMPKYSLGEMSNPSQGGDTHLYNNTYSLVYVDANGNCSYDFPENYVINFVISNTWGGQSNEIYQSGGVTTTSEASSLTRVGLYALPNGETIQSGTERNVIDGKVRIKFGNSTISTPGKFAATQNGSIANTNFNGSTLDNSNFRNYIPGNGVKGTLNGNSTCYYFKVKNVGYLRVGVHQNGGQIKVYKSKSALDFSTSSNWTSADFTELTNANTSNQMEMPSSNDGIIGFPVDNGYVYAVYSDNGELGYYGYHYHWSRYNNEPAEDKPMPTWGEADCGTIFNQADWGFNYINVMLGKVSASTPVYFSETKPGDGNHPITDFPYLTEGNGNNGGFGADATTYFIRPTQAGVLRVAVKLNKDKTMKVIDLGEWGWYNTSGTEVISDYKSATDPYYGTYDFDVQANHVYAVYAQGSKLGFFGCELLTRNGSTQSSVSVIEKRTISTKPDYYSDSDMNAEIHSTTFGYGVGGYGVTDPHTSHTAVFQSKVGDEDITFVGFEDWVDFDFNDLVFAVTGTKTEIPQDPIVIPEDPDDPDEPEEPGTFICRVIAEDLTVSDNTDFDFNDVVFDVYSNGVIRIRACGGTLPLKVDGQEVHGLFGKGTGEMINTGWDGEIDYINRYHDIEYSGGNVADVAAANLITVEVYKQNQWITLMAPVGEVASKIAVGEDYPWCSEREDIDSKWRLRDGTKTFSDFVKGITIGNDWYQMVIEEAAKYQNKNNH